MYFLGGNIGVAELVLVDASAGGVHQGRRIQQELEDLLSREHIVCVAEKWEQAWTIH